MSLRKLPKIKNFDKPQGFQWDAPSDALTRWSVMPQAAEADDKNTISIYDAIGDDPWGGGFSAARAAAALRSIGPNPVTVKINSPGGDMFDGIAIYNLLREHPAKVSVEIVGIAASAASVIAMAGDEIGMGIGTFMMIHNAWGIVIGNRHDMRESANLFDGFDAALADIYEARTGQKRSEIEAWMDAETFMGPSDAVGRGFADQINEQASAPEAKNSASEPPAVRRLDAILAKSGIPRSERRTLLAEVKEGGTHDAALTVTHDADLDVSGLKALMKSF